MTNTTSAATDSIVRYTVTLTLDRPVRYDLELPLSEQEVYAVSQEAKRELERY